MRRVIIVLIAWHFASSSLAAQSLVDRKRQAVSDRGVQVEHAAADASLRSPVAAPTIELTAEVGDDKKTATAKAGFAWHQGFTSEAGVTGAFDKTADRTPLTSLRALTSGSSAWFATAWKKYRVHFDPTAEDAVCRQAAWAAGVGFLDFDCDQAALSDESYAQRLAALAEPDLERGVCQQFQRAMLSGSEVTTGTGVAPKCSLDQVSTLATQYNARFTQSYAARYKAAAGTPPAASTEALGICNEFRRSIGLPPDPHCDPDNLDKVQQKNWSRSWQERLTNFRRDREAAICDEYRLAKGETPTGQPGCAAPADLRFTQSFKGRYAATYRWLNAPIFNGRLDVSRGTFKYFDDTLTSHKDLHSSYALTGSAGMLFVNDTYLGVNYSWGRQWKAQDSVELCQPFHQTGAASCQEAAIIGAPDKKNRSQLEAQVKGYLTDSLGAALYVTRDFSKHAWGIDAPLYFLKDKSGGLAGGLVATYRSDAKAFVVSVFVGQVFSVF